LILFIMQHPTTASIPKAIKMSQVLPSPRSDRPPEDTKNKVKETSNWSTHPSQNLRLQADQRLSRRALDFAGLSLRRSSLSQAQRRLCHRALKWRS